MEIIFESCTKTCHTRWDTLITDDTLERLTEGTIWWTQETKVSHQSPLNTSMWTVPTTPSPWIIYKIQSIESKCFGLNIFYSWQNMTKDWAEQKKLCLVLSKWFERGVKGAVCICTLNASLNRDRRRYNLPPIPNNIKERLTAGIITTGEGTVCRFLTAFPCISNTIEEV